MMLILLRLYLFILKNKFIYILYFFFIKKTYVINIVIIEKQLYSEDILQSTIFSTMAIQKVTYVLKLKKASKR